MNKRKPLYPGSGLTRRDFIKYTAGATMMLGMPGLLTGCSDSGSPPPPNPGTESKTFYLDLSHGSLELQYYLVADPNRYPLLQADAETRRRARAAIPALGSVSDAHITHVVQDLPLPSDSMQTLYVVGRDPSGDDPSWTFPLFFFHLPESSLRYAWRTMRDIYPELAAAPTIKFGLYGLHVLRDREEDYVLQHDFKNPADMATAMMFHHPELLSLESNSGAHILQNIIGTNAYTSDLAARIQFQGAATEDPDAGWAYLKPITDPDTGQPYLNSHGEHICFVRWSDMTMKAAGHVSSSPSSPLTQAQNDPTLGCNITNLDPEVENSELNGKIWTVHDGVATIDASSLSAAQGTFDYTLPDQSRHQSYQVKLTDVDADRKVTIEVKNWGLRYLGLYIRFLKADGTAIKVSGLPSTTTDDFPDGLSKFDGDKDKCAALITPEFTLFAIPINHATVKFSFHMPDEASGALILSGGLGTGSHPFPDTTQMGSELTCFINLALPSLFLVWGVPTGYVQVVGGLGFFEYLQLIPLLLVAGISDAIMGGCYKDPSVMLNLAELLITFLISKSATWFLEKITAAKASGEISNAIPFVGSILLMLASASLIAEIGETSDVVANCPKTYKNTLTFTHDLEVTIFPDPDHPKIFPETATHYQLIAQFDQGTPVSTGPIEMPIPSPEKIVYTFKGVPYGGYVNVSVGFYSDTNWTAGKGSTGPILNTVDQASFNITEIKVPIGTDTQYSHKQKTVLDKDGNRLWAASDAPPVVPLSCRNQAGQLCLLTGITLSQHFEAAGYSWQSYSPDVGGCESGQPGQFHQMASMAITEIPQRGYGGSPCGFTSPVRMVYDLIGKGNENYYLDNTNNQRLVRRMALTLDGPPQIDGPDSNLAWGQFNNPVDALVLHPSRKLVSVSMQYHKIEVLDLPDEALPDQGALLAQAYSGQGLREGLVNTPVAAAVTPEGAIYVLESGNRRIQAFDLGINPVRLFKGGAHYMALREETEQVTYLDLSVEFTGYIYVLSCSSGGMHYLDIYSPEGNFLSRTIGVNAGRFSVDFWRNAYTLNYEYLTLPDGDIPGFTEPSVSLWIPSTP